MQTAIGILKVMKFQNIELVIYHPYWKGNDLCKQTSDLWTCNLVHHPITKERKEEHRQPRTLFTFVTYLLGCFWTNFNEF